MRAAMAAFLPLAVILIGCSETKPLPPPAYVLDGIRVYGRAQSLSKSQIRAAIAEDRRRSSQPDENLLDWGCRFVWGYFFPPQREKRVEKKKCFRPPPGRWEAGDRMISGSALLVPTQ